MNYHSHTQNFSAFLPRSVPDPTPMHIANDSPLRHLPADMDRKQMLFFDGIRVAAEMADLSYRRVVSLLSQISDRELRREHQGPSLVEVVHDAWAFIDSVQRLRLLLGNCPRLQQSKPPYQLFMRGTEGVEALRDIVQHLNGAIETLAPLDQPAWGTLSWLKVIDADTKSVYVATIVLGSGFESEHPILDRLESVPPGVSHVTLRSGGHSVDLSDVMHRVSQIIASIEAGLATSTAGVRTLSTDFVLSAIIEFGDQSGDGEPDNGSLDRDDLLRARFRLRHSDPTDPPSDRAAP